MILFAFILILAFSIGRYFDLSALSLHSGCAPIGFLYPLAHASFFHLSFNLLAILSFWSAIPQWRRATTVASLLLTFPVVTYVGMLDKPTVGASGIACGLIGSYICYIMAEHRRLFAQTALPILLVIIIQSVLFHDSINWRIHLSALVLSFLCSLIMTRR